MKASEINNTETNNEDLRKPLISPCRSLVNDRPKQHPASAFRAAVGDQNMINDINLCLSRASDRKGFFVGSALTEGVTRNLWLSMAEALNNNFAYFGRALLSDPPNLKAIPERADTLAQTVWHESVGIEIKKGCDHSRKFNEMVIVPLVWIFKYLSQGVLMVSRVGKSPGEARFRRARVSPGELGCIAEEVGFAKYKIACWLANWGAMVEFDESVKTEINKIVLTVEDSVREMAGSRDEDIQDALDQYHRSVQIASAVEDMRSIFDHVEEDSADEESRESSLLEGSSSAFSETGSEASDSGFSSDASLESRDADRHIAAARYAMRSSVLAPRESEDDSEGEGMRSLKRRRIDKMFVCPSEIDRDIRNSALTSNDVSAVDFGKFALGRGIERQRQQGATLESCKQVIAKRDFMQQSSIDPQFEVVAAPAVVKTNKKGGGAERPISAEVIGKWPRVKQGGGILASQEEVEKKRFPERIMIFR